MDGLLIRSANSGDLEAVYALVCELEACTFDREVFAALFEANISHPEYRYLVAALDDHVVGLISLHSQRLLHHCGVVGEIQELIVTEACRGNKIGERLLNEALAWSKKKNWLQIEVSSNIKREGAHRFYLSNGFSHNHFKFVTMLS